MEVGFKTDKGRRRSNNEDAYFVMIKEKIFIIADGVGGNNSGEIASRTAVNEVANYIKDHPLKKAKNGKAIIAYFRDCIKNVNFKVLELSERFEQNKGMATTLVIGYLFKNKIYVFNVGDSRAYLYRRNYLNQITVDHSYVNTLVKAGLISEEEAQTHENKNMITRAVGSDYDVEADAFEIKVSSGDILLMCTDGLHDELSEQEITCILDEDMSISDITSNLVDKANEHGGNDNITIVCIRIMEEDINE